MKKSHVTTRSIESMDDRRNSQKRIFMWIVVIAKRNGRDHGQIKNKCFLRRIDEWMPFYWNCMCLATIGDRRVTIGTHLLLLHTTIQHTHYESIHRNAIATHREMRDREWICRLSSSTSLRSTEEIIYRFLLMSQTAGCRNYSICARSVYLLNAVFFSFSSIAKCPWTFSPFAGRFNWEYIVYLQYFLETPILSFEFQIEFFWIPTCAVNRNVAQFRNIFGQLAVAHGNFSASMDFNPLIFVPRQCCVQFTLHINRLCCLSLCVRIRSCLREHADMRLQEITSFICFVRVETATLFIRCSLVCVRVCESVSRLNEKMHIVELKVCKASEKHLFLASEVPSYGCVIVAKCEQIRLSGINISSRFPCHHRVKS